MGERCGALAKQPASSLSVENSCDGSFAWNAVAVLIFHWTRLRRRQWFISDTDNYITNVVICSFLTISSHTIIIIGGGGKKRFPDMALNISL
jgi:hypothetical protein